MSDYPANAAPNPPPPVSSDLRVYTDAGGNVWGRDYATGIGYLLSSPQGAVGAPPATGGNAVQKTGDTMSGPLAIATDVTPELHLTSAAGDLTLDLSPTALKMTKTANGTSLTLSMPTTGGASVTLTGSAGASGNKTSLGLNYISVGNQNLNAGNSPIGLLQQSNGNLFIQGYLPDGVTAASMYLTDFANNRLIAPSASLSMISPDALSKVTLTLANGGDIVATATAGPNAGKSVNLTTGKWV